MKLDNKELFQLLNEKEIFHLYHANTVTTSTSFLKEYGLLSRGGIEQKKLSQTPQKSDNIDKLFQVWNDVFLDTTDLHTYFSRQNYYGPVCFKFSTQFLIEQDFDVWITKNNPTNWTHAMTDEDKYFKSVDELRDNWDLYQRQRKMFTIRNIAEPILFDYLEKITIDDPQVMITESKFVFFNEAKQKLFESIKDNIHLKSKFKKRVCNTCYCKQNYINDHTASALKKLFI